MKKKNAEQDLSVEQSICENSITLAAADEQSARKSPIMPEETKGVYVYIGPSIRGVITNGSIRKGTKSSIIAELGIRAENFPLIKKLLIIDNELAKARQKLSSGDNAISIAYHALEKQIKEVN